MHNIPKVTRRTAALLERTVYTKVSDYITRQGLPIGNGLFPTISRSKGDAVVNFVGEIITRHEYNGRVANGYGGYAVQMSASEVLDCYNYKASCKASMCNDFHNIIHKIGGAVGFANVNIVVDTKRQSARLVAMKGIPANTEMLTTYGPLFEMEAQV